MDDDDVAGLDVHVLVQLLALDQVVVVELEGVLAVLAGRGLDAVAGAVDLPCLRTNGDLDRAGVDLLLRRDDQRAEPDAAVRAGYG